MLGAPPSRILPAPGRPRAVTRRTLRRMLRPTSTVIIGAGQAGLALSRFLTQSEHDHVVLERGRVGERWRGERWPALWLLTPNWLNVLPGAQPLPDADGFQPA